MAVAITLCLPALPALADWRDFMGKSLIVNLKQSGRIVTDVIAARGGASTEDRVYTYDCDWTYHLYVSGKGRLFIHLSRTDCADSDPYTYDVATGQMFDLNRASGMADMGPDAPPAPYVTELAGEELTISLPPHNYTWQGGDYVFSLSNSTATYFMKMRFADDCAMTVDYSGAYRSEYQSTTSKYYTLEDTEMTLRMTTTTCRVVEGFLLK